MEVLGTLLLRPSQAGIVTRVAALVVLASFLIGHRVSAPFREARRQSLDRVYQGSRRNLAKMVDAITILSLCCAVTMSYIVLVNPAFSPRNIVLVTSSFLVVIGMAASHILWRIAERGT